MIAVLSTQARLLPSIDVSTRSRLLTAVAAGLVPASAALLTTSASADSTVVFTFADSAITESSGLVTVGDLFVTVNDSGDSGRVFVVDGSGRTVGLTQWDGLPTDDEALAPADGASVWVGDIGDNSRQRRTIQILKVPVGAVAQEATPTAYTLRYPTGSHNAEALLVHPVTGRVYIATKQVTGAALYAAPVTLRPDAVNPLTRIAPVTAIVTDGAFTADGTHVLLRTYGKIYLYGFPSMRLLGSALLPSQPQGEGLAVTADHAIYLSSEGVNSAVLAYTLPPRLARLVAAGGRLDDAATAQDAAPLLATLGWGAAAAAANAAGAALG